MAEWINSDGLRVRFGTEEAEVTRGGELPSAGALREISFHLTLTTLGTASALVPDTTGIVVPSGARIYEIEVLNETEATSGGLATLNLGLARLDTTTAIDIDGLLVAAPLADYNLAGETKVYTIGVTGVGALVGTTLTNPGVLVADYDTAAFTAGELRVIVRFYIPRPAASN